MKAFIDEGLAGPQGQGGGEVADGYRAPVSPVCCVAVCALAAQAADGASLVFVSNQDAATVSVIDTASDTVVGNIPVAFAPAGIAADRDGQDAST